MQVAAASGPEAMEPHDPADKGGGCTNCPPLSTNPSKRRCRGSLPTRHLASPCKEQVAGQVCSGTSHLPLHPPDNFRLAVREGEMMGTSLGPSLPPAGPPAVKT